MNPDPIRSREPARGLTYGLIALLCLIWGSTWLVMKTEDETQKWARKSASYVLGYVGLFIAVVSISMPIMKDAIRVLWFSLPNFYFLQPMPILSVVFFIMLWRDLRTEREYRPFFLTLGIFLMNYVGIGVSTWPWLVPFKVTLWGAAAAPESQSLLLLGTIFLLPCVLAYTGYCFGVLPEFTPERRRVGSDKPRRIMRATKARGYIGARLP